jgi:hypothetical protein
MSLFGLLISLIACLKISSYWVSFDVCETVFLGIGLRFFAEFGDRWCILVVLFAPLYIYVGENLDGDDWVGGAGDATGGGGE